MRDELDAVVAGFTVFILFACNDHAVRVEFFKSNFRSFRAFFLVSAFCYVLLWPTALVLMAVKRARR